MRRPRVLWIGHKRWKVRYKRRMAPVRPKGKATRYYVGDCDHERHRLTLALNAPDPAHTMLHEIVHAGWYEAGYKNHGERRIDTAVWAILEALRGNPRLVDLLLDGIPSYRGRA